MKVTVYEPDGPCYKCKTTKSALENKGIEYETATANDETIEQWKKDGYLSFPVVVVEFGDGVTYQWSDLRVDRINELAKLL